MAITTILMWVLGTVLVSMAIAIVIDKLRHAGNRARVVEADLADGEREPASWDSGPQAAGGMSLSDLSALLTALSPEPEGMAPGEAHAEPTTVEATTMGQWPGQCPTSTLPPERADGSRGALGGRLKTGQ